MILLAIGLRPTFGHHVGICKSGKDCVRAACLPDHGLSNGHVVPALGPQCWFDRGAPFQVCVCHIMQIAWMQRLCTTMIWPICAQLALEAGDWVIHRLELAGIDDDPSEFRIARKISYDAEHLQEEARQQKENNLAMRAFRLMQRLKSGQKRQRRPRGPQPSTKKARQTAMPCDEQGELSPSRLSEESLV